MSRGYLLVSLLLWALASIGAIASKAGKRSSPLTRGDVWFTRVLYPAMLIWTVLCLTACGGGDPDLDAGPPAPPAASAPAVPTPTVNCALNPRACG